MRGFFASGADMARSRRPRTNPGKARITGRFAPWEEAAEYEAILCKRRRYGA